MSNKTLNLTDQLYDYILKSSLREPEVLRELRDTTMQLPEHNMQISPEQGQFMRLMVQLINGHKGIEVGVFTGYSALSVAMGLPEDGRLVALDISEEWTNVGQTYWAKAGVADKIDLRIGPAVDSLQKMLAAGEQGQYDFAFIDADKENYLNYYEYCLQLLRPNGLIMVDNVLWSGDVIDPSKNGPEVNAIRNLNQHIAQDQRVDIILLPISDGITLVRKL